MSKIKKFLLNYYPWIIIIVSALLLYGPYLSGSYVIQSSASLNKYNIFEFLLSDHVGWINFFKSAGEFAGGDYTYGWFNPIYIIFRAINLSDYFLAEHLLGFIYFGGAFAASYFLFRKNAYAKWISIFAASIFAFNGFALKADQNTSNGFTNALFFPLLFLLAQRGLKSNWHKIIFALLIGLQVSYSNPQLVLWQLIFIFAYILFCKNNKWKLIYRFAIAGIGGIILSIPQYLLTSSMFVYDTQALGVNVMDSGSNIYNLIHVFFPFFATDITNYVAPYYFTTILGSLMLILFVPTFIKKWKQLPRNIKFFFIVAIFSLVATIENNPIQYLIGHIPFINIFLARTPIRYIHIYAFSIAFLVAYLLRYHLSNKEQIIKFSKKIFFIGLLVSLGYLISTTIFAFAHERIFAMGKDWLINNRLPNTRGNYPEIYYVNLFHYYFYTIGKKFTLLSWSGVFNALPFISFVFWWIWAHKNEKITKFWPTFLIINIIFTSFLYALILGQAARVRSDFAWKANPDNNINTYLNDQDNVKNYYFMAYGNFVGETFYRQNYLDSHDIVNWLGTNHYSSGKANYQSAPQFQNFTDPFQVLRYRIITTYIGFMNADLYNANRFPQEGKTDPAILNPAGIDKHQINEENISNNLSEKINFLRNIGIRYISSHILIEDENLELVKKVNFIKESELIPGFTAHLYIYQIKNPGNIIYVPRKIETVATEKIDVLDFEQIKNILDKVNNENIITVESNLENIFDQDPAKQKIVVQKMDNDQIIFDTDFSEDTFVVININHYHGWRAWIDEDNTDLLRANINFMSVKVPAGKHNVKLEFDPMLMIKDSF